MQLKEGPYAPSETAEVYTEPQVVLWDQEFARRGKGDRRTMKNDPLEIPEFLKISAEERKAAWKGREHTNPFSGETDEAWRAREKERRAAIEDARKLKNARGLAKIKQAHPGERWDRKHKIWVPL